MKDNSVNNIEQEKARWLNENKISRVEKAKTDLGTEIELLYTPSDVREVEYLKDLGFPGEYPFLRGVYPTMYRERLWDMRQYAGFGTAEDTNARWKFLLAGGQQSLSLACDLPTQSGFDSDNPLVEDEVGRVGCAIDTLRDMEILFDGLPIERLPTSFNLTSQAATLLAMYLAVAEKHGVAPSSLMGTVANDILTEYVSRGAWIFAPKPSLRLATDILQYCIENMPRFYPFNLRGVLFYEAGSDLAQEVGYTFANAIAHIEDGLKRGLDIDKIAPRVSFFFTFGTQIFQQVAKFRAARRLWAKIVKERFGAKKQASMRMRTTGMHAASQFAAREPELNLVRGAYGALAGVLGGCQAMWLPAMDENYAIPTEKTARLALRTQQVLAEETDVTATVDPLGGSYYVEALTNLMEKEIAKRIEEVERLGGSVKAIESGYLQKIIADRAAQIQRDIESGRRVIVGVNKYQIEDEKLEMSIHEANPAAVKLQIERLKEVKAERDNSSVKKALVELYQAARGNNNLLPPLISAVKTYASIGEITSVLKEVFGEFREPVNM